MNRNIRLTSLSAVTGLLILALFVVWGAGMFCLTCVTAEYAAARYLNGYGDFASTITARSFEHQSLKDLSSKYENYDANRRWEAVDNGGRANSFHSSQVSISKDAGFLNRTNNSKVYSAAAVYDAEGNPLECSWSDFFYFEYLTEEQWDNREERSGNNARAFFHRGLLTSEGQELVGDSSLTFDAAAMRFTGVFDGIEFTPNKIEYISWDAFQDILHSKAGGQYTVPEIVENHNLQWIPLYDDPDAVSHSAEPVTFYSDWFNVCCNQPSPDFTYKDRHYESANDLVDQLGPQLTSGSANLTAYEGLDLIIPSVNYCFSIGNEVYYSPYYYGESAYEGDSPELHFYTVTAVYCSPWRTAFGELRMVYLNTLLLTAVLVVLLRTIVNRYLITPVQTVGEAMVREEENSYLYTAAPKIWYESRIIQEGFERCSDKLRMQKNEIRRLNTALEYAKEAEQNRRQMTSNLAHELKTPLAVIHSYAEGLKEHIAEDKRDKYVDVILGEAARTDGMVLEMLDLSRLEAGKVKLARDEFSLADLTKHLFEKLEMAAKAKDLQINYDFPGQCTVIADENRIAQVIENFATNALKYTHAGGQITVRIQKYRKKTTFSIENDCEPLSDEALAKVWDTFYRVDESRAKGGTGLGLAIAKNIVELHGGTCSARSTKTGVVFEFSI